MQWILELLGIRTSTKRLRQQISQLQKKAFEAQRNGNLRLAGKYLSEAKDLEEKLLAVEDDQDS